MFLRMYSGKVTNKSSKPGPEGKIRNSRKKQEKRIPPKVSFYLLLPKGTFHILNVLYLDEHRFFVDNILFVANINY